MDIIRNTSILTKPKRIGKYLVVMSKHLVGGKPSYAVVAFEGKSSPLGHNAAFLTVGRGEEQSPFVKSVFNDVRSEQDIERVVATKRYDWYEKKEEADRWLDELASELRETKMFW